MKVTIVRGRATDAAVFKLAETLADEYNVSLLVWDRQNTLEGCQPGKYRIRRFRMRAPYDRASIVLFLPFWWAYALFRLIKNDSAVIHACDLDTLFPAILVKLLKRVKLCYTIYDFYANNIPDGNWQPLRKLARYLLAVVEKVGIGFTDVLVLVDESRFDEVRGAHIKKLVYAYNSPPDVFEIASQANKHDGVLLFYGGVILRTRGLEHIINVVREMDGVNLVIAGTGPDKDMVETISNGRVEYLGWLPSYQNIIEKTLEADIVLRFSDPRLPKTRFESPNKLFEAMMCRKPIIVSDGASMSEIVRREKCGVVVPYGDIKALREAILMLKNDPELRARLGKNGRKAYEERYSWEKMAGRLKEAYGELVRSG